MARQLSRELIVPYEECLQEAVYNWIQEAKEEAKVFRRVHGYFSDDLTWMSLRPTIKVSNSAGMAGSLCMLPRYAPRVGSGTVSC